MGRKGVRVSKEEKLMIVEQICSGQMSVIEGSRQLRIVESKVRYMTKLYCKHGPLAFVDSGKNNVYSAETKLHAVLSYLQGEGSLDEVASNYGLRSIEPLRKWIKMYNDGELFLQRKMSGGSRMTTSRPTTKEERIKIVMECIAPLKLFLLTAILTYHKFAITAQTRRKVNVFRQKKYPRTFSVQEYLLNLMTLRTEWLFVFHKNMHAFRIKQ